MGLPWTSLVAQLVKNLPAMQETSVYPWVGEGNGYLFQYSGLENSMDCIVHGVTSLQANGYIFCSLIRAFHVDSRNYSFYFWILN